MLIPGSTPAPLNGPHGDEARTQGFLRVGSPWLPLVKGANRQQEGAGWDRPELIPWGGMERLAEGRGWGRASEGLGGWVDERLG